MSISLGPGAEFGHYRIESLLGRGGMSVVYLAQDENLGRQVAIKVLAPELAADENFRTRFTRESQLAAGLEHPNIVPVYEAGDTGEHLFIAMRYVRGSDLRTLITQQGRLGPEQTASLLRPVATALDAAHRRGLVHRDVKPANILIAIDEGEEHPYLSDFGLTKHTASKSGLTKTGQFMGTVDYVAPEQIKGEEVDGRTDEYSLACVLYQCLSGKVPFNKDTDVATMFGHLQDEPPRVTEHRSDLPAEVDDVLGRGMAKERDERYPTCTAMLDAFGQTVGMPSGPRDTPSLAATMVATPPQPAAEPPMLPPAPETSPTPSVAPVARAPEVAAATAPPPSGGGARSKLIAIIAVAVAAVAAVIIGVIALGGGDEPEPPPPTGPTGQVPPEPTVLSNAEAIAIPDSGPATPYPSTIEVSGLQGTVSDVNVTVTGLTHGFPDDVDMLLVGPGGQNVVLAADAGGGEDANAQTLTFDDGAAGTLRDENAPRSDAVRPQSFGLGFEGPAPAPAAPFGETLAVFNGTDPNGTWQLFVFDDAGSDEGEIAGGWSLEITVDPAGTPPTGATGPSEASFSNTAAMTIPDFGQAVPYPSEIEVSGMGDSIVDVNVTLVGLSHSFLEDLGVLVVGPTGENTVLMARAGGFRNANDRTLTFDDQATEVLRDERPPVGDLVRPQAFEPGFEGEPPAPEPPFGETLAVFNGTDPNGTWQLFVFDAGAGDLGEITGGWSLTITVG